MMPTETNIPKDPTDRKSIKEYMAVTPIIAYQYEFPWHRHEKCFQKR